MSEIFNLDLPEVKTNEELQALILEYSHLDPGYINTSTSVYLKFQKKLIEDMWSKYKKFADPGFIDRLRSKGEFLNRAWEMVSACALIDLGYLLRSKNSDNGPDACVVLSPSVWVESVICTPGQGPDAVPSLRYGVVQDLPKNEMVLRFGNAITTKFRKYQIYLSSGVISDNEPYIIAVSKGSISHPDPHPSVALRYLYGIGDVALKMPLDPITGERKVTETFFTRQTPILKKLGSDVPVAFFEDIANSGVSAVIYSDNNILNHPIPLGSDFILFRNPNAKNPIPDNFLSIGAEWIPKDGIIKYIEKKFIKSASYM